MESSRESLLKNEASSIAKKVAVPTPKTISVMANPLVQMQQQLGNRRLLKMIQTKLTVGQPGDVYEQEADRTADQVMRMPDPSLQRQQSEEEENKLQTSALAGSISPLVQRQQPEEEEKLQAKSFSGGQMLQKQNPKEEEEEPLQAEETSNAVGGVAPGVESGINNLRGSGQALPETVRNYFEPRFGYDFGQVRIHTGSQAAEAAQSVNAKAFTLGQDVVFGAGQYTPEHEEGKN